VLHVVRSLALGLVALLAIALLAEALLEWRDAQARPVRGRLVDADGIRMRIVEAGMEHAGPTVVLECGIGGATAANWAWILRGVERFAPVVAYDRAGLGWSKPGPMPRDGVRIVRELHALLRSSGHAPPYVFVGHSYGGLLARLFVDQYPDEVAGLVLIDSSHPGQFGNARKPPRWLHLARTLLPAAPWAARLGLMRIGVHFVKMDVKLLPEPERSEQLDFYGRASHWVGTRREMQAWQEYTNPEVRRTGRLGARPLAVLTAGAREDRPGWGTLQDSIAALSTNSAHEFVAHTTHGGMLSDSAAAERSIAAIRAVREAIASGGRVRLEAPH
jgi:pimeloyl-ACP methyl ester carboxylesterase